MGQTELKTSTNVRHIDDLRKFIKSSSIEIGDTCIVGSSILAKYGLRQNNDIDLAVLPTERGKISQSALPNNVDICNERYSCMDLTDRDLINNDNYHIIDDGFKFALPEIESSFKYRRWKDKDKRDLSLMREKFLSGDDYDWDWNKFEYEYNPSNLSKKGYPISDRTQKSLLCSFEEVRLKKGLFAAISESLDYLNNRITGRETSPKSVEMSKSNTVYFIIWPTAAEFFDAISDLLDDQFGILEREKLDLEKGIEDFIMDMYDGDENKNFIEYKCHNISKEGGRIMIVGTRVPMTPSGDPDSKMLQEAKRNIRKQYYKYISSPVYHDVLHGPDSMSENNHIRSVIRQHST